jgi:DNA-binding MarR family transcriptional regulator
LTKKVKLPYEMATSSPSPATVQTVRPLPALLTEVKMAAVRKVLSRAADAGHPDIREGYGCVFGFIDVENGSRLTELADASGLTKQAVGEAVTELERLGYLTREPDPSDRRAKIIKLNDRGVDAYWTARRLFAEIEQEWAEQLGEDLIATLREAAEKIFELETAPTGVSQPAA